MHVLLKVFTFSKKSIYNNKIYHFFLFDFRYFMISKCFCFLGTATEEGETDKDPEIQIDRDDSLNKVTEIGTLKSKEVFLCESECRKVIFAFAICAFILMLMERHNDIQPKINFHLG